MTRSTNMEHVEVLRHMKETIKAIAPSEVAALDAAIASLSAPKPEGEWVLVPREPTPEMLREGSKWNTEMDSFPDDCGGTNSVWADMLAAAPQPPAEPTNRAESSSKLVDGQPTAEAQPDRMAIKLLVAAGFVTEAKANEALNIAHGFCKGPLAPPSAPGCGSCSDGCVARGTCRVRDESPPSAPVEVKSVEAALQKWLDWCNEHDEEPDAWAGARIVIEALAQQPAAERLAEALRASLEAVQGALQEAYHSAGQECCGRGGMYGCCGAPEAVWTPEDQAVMDKLAPIQRLLTAALRDHDQEVGNG